MFTILGSLALIHDRMIARTFTFSYPQSFSTFIFNISVITITTPVISIWLLHEKQYYHYETLLVLKSVYITTIYLLFTITNLPITTIIIYLFISLLFT